MTNDEMMSAIGPFIDKDGRVTAFPSKRKKQLMLLVFIAPKIEKNRDFTEKEINDVLDDLHTFSDHCLLRRDLCDCGFMERDRNGKTYRMKDVQPTPEELGL